MTTNQPLHNGVSGIPRPGEMCPRDLATGVFPFLLGNALLGTIGVFVHQAGTDPLTTTWFRCAFGLLCLTLWLHSRGSLRSLRLSPATGPWVVLAGSLMVLSWVLFFYAIEQIPTGIAVVLFHVQPLWVFLLSAVLLKEPVGRQYVASVFGAMFGLALATGVFEHTLPGPGSMLQSDYWLGVVACLVGAFCPASVTLINRRLSKMPTGILAWWQCAIGALVLGIWPVRHGWPAWGGAWGWLAGLGLIHTGLAYTLIFAGMSRLKTGRIVVFQFVYPMAAIFVDWQYFDQRLSYTQLLGIALMSAAIWFAEQTPGKHRVPVRAVRR